MANNMIFDPINKVYLKGKVFNKPKVHFDQEIGSNVLNIVVAVPRNKDLYKNAYNTDLHNYFYCLLYEDKFTMEELKNIQSTIGKMDKVEIKGFLDNRINPMAKKEYDDKHIKYRTLNQFVSTINVCSISKVEFDRKDPKEVADNKVLKFIKGSFGTDVEVTIEENAHNVDYLGFSKDDDLPDY